MRSVLAALLLAAAPLASAAPPGAGEVEQMELEFSSWARHFDADRARIEDLRRSYPRAPDPEAALQEMGMGIGKVYNAFTAAAALAKRHRKAVENLAVIAASGGMFNAFSRGPRVPSDGGKAYAFQRVDEEMRVKIDAAFRDINAVTRAYEELARAHKEAKEARRRLRLALKALAILAVGAALVWRFGDATPGAPQARVLVPEAAYIPRRVAGHFDVLAPLGRGAMGEVYAAVDTSLNRRAALKRLRPELLSDPAELEALLKEARLMAALKHPNLVAVYSVERDAGQVYICMEFVDGISLQRRLDAEKRLPWPEALRIARAAGAGLDYAHENGVVHRDLKPSNIMLSATGEVKVMDFGIAHKAAKSVSRLTRAPAWGTPAYMAPEQELGGVSAAVDLFALSVCLYEMLTGELPFKGPNFLAQKRESLWTPPSRLVAGLPAGLDAVFALALAPEPSRRFKTAGDTLAACAALNS